MDKVEMLEEEDEEKGGGEERVGDEGGEISRR